MSSFQIPGLGQAKPNETLPPLLPDVHATAVSVTGDEQSTKPTQIDTGAPLEENTEPRGDAAIGSSDVKELPEAMAVDQPESPPSLTHALEAAIGGLEEPTSVQPQVVSEVPDGEPQEGLGQNPEWEMDSSPCESSSDSSSSESSDEDSDNEAYELLGVEETARLLMEAEGGSDDEGDKSGKTPSAGQVRTKNELPDELIPKPDVTITPEMKIEELGSVEHIVENIMLVKAITPGEYQVLDTGSVLCNADRVVIGAVAETIGKVLQPLYTVRFNSQEEIKEVGLEVGTKVYYSVDHASYVFTEPLKNLKGSDASNLHDEEVGDEEMEFSDDEKEVEYKRAMKQKRKDKWKNGGTKGARDPHPLRQEIREDGGLNYDDDDGPYKPLTRPPGFGSGPVTNETYELPPRSVNQRGRRGDSRGRGNRGRGSGRGGRGGRGSATDGYSLPPQANQAQTAPPPQWNGNASPGGPVHGVPPLPNFGFQVPAWPQPAQGQPNVPVPPPPGWPAQGQAQGQGAANGAFVNPAFFAALMSQMQAQGGQGQWGGQQPPHGGQGQ